MYSFEYVAELSRQLGKVPPHEIAADPLAYSRICASLIDTAPTTQEGWQEEGVEASDFCTRDLGRAVAMHVFDHIASLPVDGIAKDFVGLFSSATEVREQTAAPLSSEILSVAVARTMNSVTALPKSREVITTWALGQLDDTNANRALEQLSANGFRHFREIPGLISKLGPQSVQTIAQHANRQEIADRHQRRASGQDRGAVAQALLATRQRQQAEQAAREAEQATINSVCAAKDESTFWQLCAQLQQDFPESNALHPSQDVATLERQRESALYNKWRTHYLNIQRQVLANNILSEQGKTLEDLVAPPGCQGLQFGSPPTGFAVFPNIKSLENALTAFYTPTDPAGRAVTICNDVQKNNAFLTTLQQDIRSWHSGPKEHFTDLTDRYELTGTAFRQPNIQVLRGESGTVLVNQLDVGIFAGAEVTFQGKTSVDYLLSVPTDTSGDQPATYDYNPGADRPPKECDVTLRPTPVNAESVARHIQRVLNTQDGYELLLNSIRNPLTAYDELDPPSLHIGSTELGIAPEYHNPRLIGYTPPDAVQGYQTANSFIYPNNVINPAHIAVLFKQLAPDQAATIWAMGHLVR